MVQRNNDWEEGERLASEYLRTREGGLKTPEEELREQQILEWDALGLGSSSLGDDMLTTLEEQEDHDRRLEQQYTAAYDIHLLDRDMLSREDRTLHGDLEKREDELAFEQQKSEEDDWPLGQTDPTRAIPHYNSSDDREGI